MYERAGFMATDDGALVMLAGSTLGGGEHMAAAHGGCVAAITSGACPAAQLSACRLSACSRASSAGRRPCCGLLHPLWNRRGRTTGTSGGGDRRCCSGWRVQQQELLSLLLSTCKYVSFPSPSSCPADPSSLLRTWCHGCPPGTKINWTASLKPPPHVRQEWASAPHGLAHLGPDSPAFDAALDAVCSRLGVCTGTARSTPNAKMEEGLRALQGHVEE